MRWSVFVQPESTEVVWQVCLLGGWMSAAVFCARWSGLGERRRPWANVLSLVAGPIGWGAHLLPHAWARWAGGRGAEGNTEGYERIAHNILTAALEKGASDVHIEAQEKGYSVRFRQVGFMREHLKLNRRGGEMLVAVFKVFADLNTAEKQHLQDGRFRWTDPKSGHVLDVRISTSPALSGEKVALRLLNRPAVMLRLDKIGMSPESCEAIRRNLRQPEGLVLVAGPTGSGKTSTSYALLQEVSGPSVNTVTIEDPVEYALPHATQIGINPKMGVTFESSLRTVLRQDPNVIFIGEMRDPESFKIGVRAAMSGHLVISTMHARDTVSAMTALRNLDLDRQVLSAAVRMLISQRLVRELCPSCRVWAAPDADARDFFTQYAGKQPLPARVAQPSTAGCPHCQQGFVGRTGVFEVLRIDGLARKWISDGDPEIRLREVLRENGFISMREHACMKMAAGEVWIDDAVRALGLQEG